MNSIKKVEAQVLDHIGIVSDIIEKLDLVQIIDQLIPKKASHFQLTHGQVVKAIILSGLGFCDRRLYSIDRFFKYRPVEKLFGQGISWKDFSDDVMAKTLDKIYSYGITKFHFDVVTKILLRNRQLFNFVVNLDSTSISLLGKYKKKDSDIHPLHGHSKDHRPDLLQMVLSLGLTGPAKIPFWMSVHDGNVSDKKLFPVIIDQIESFKKAVYGNGNNMLYVADSSLFSKHFVSKFGRGTSWVTRLPESYKIAKELLKETDPFWKKHGKYRYDSQTLLYNGTFLRCIIVYHRRSAYKEYKTLIKNYKRKANGLKKKVNALEKRVFKNKKRIEREIYKLEDQYPQFDIEWDAEKNKVRYRVPGRQKKWLYRYTFRGKKVQIYYSLNRQKLFNLANKKGKFIIITNVIDEKKYSDREIINFYRGQSQNERGFRFIKDKSFGLGQIYLKKPNRIAALISTMVITLLVNNYGEHLIRKKLNRKDAFFKNQLGIRTRNPTLKWIFQKFQSIVQVKVHTKNKILEYFCNIEAEHLSLIKSLGKTAQNFYGIA